MRDGQITAGVGVKQKELAYAARDAQIGGFEWFEGIPGNVGGALRMNAGAMGGETFRQVVSVRFVDPHGNFHMKTPAEMDVHYRHCGTLEKNYAVSATFIGQPEHAGGDRETARSLDAEAPHHPAAGVERGLHFQESRAMPGRANWSMNSA